MRRHDKWIDVLSKVATTVEPVAGQKLAAGIVYRNKLLSVGINKMKSHPFQRQFGKNDQCIFLHAETNAIHQAIKYNYDLVRHSTLYVVRVKEEAKKIITVLSKPCVGCERCIVEFNIKNVIYTNNEGTYSLL